MRELSLAVQEGVAVEMNVTVVAGDVVKEKVERREEKREEKEGRGEKERGEGGRGKREERREGREGGREEGGRRGIHSIGDDGIAHPFADHYCNHDGHYIGKATSQLKHDDHQRH